MLADSATLILLIVEARAIRFRHSKDAYVPRGLHYREGSSRLRPGLGDKEYRVCLFALNTGSLRLPFLYRQLVLTIERVELIACVTVVTISRNFE